MPVVTKNKALALLLISTIHEDSKVRKKVDKYGVKFG
jgi:hypothetical protein